MSEANYEKSKILSLLGMARRAGEIFIGQDKVFSVLSRELLIVTAQDCSPNVTRKLKSALSESRCICYTMQDVTREDLGRALGVENVQIAALFMESGFAGKLAELLRQGALHI